MILAEVKPREDDKYDVYVSEGAEPYVNSSQGYENVEDAIALVTKLWPKIEDCCEPGCCLHAHPDTVGRALVADRSAIVLKVTYRDGTTHTEKLR